MGDLDCQITLNYLTELHSPMSRSSQNGVFVQAAPFHREMLPRFAGPGPLEVS